jgi:LPXTG-motif cell wall-anchored protein
VFFSNGKFSVSAQLWIFAIIAILLTILVFGVWLFWKRRRNIIGSKELEGLKIDDVEEGHPPDFTCQSTGRKVWLSMQQGP